MDLFFDAIKQVGVPVGVLAFIGAGLWRSFRYATSEGGPVERITAAHVKFIGTVEESVRRQDIMLERIVEGLDRNTETLKELVELHKSEARPSRG